MIKSPSFCTPVDEKSSILRIVSSSKKSAWWWLKKTPSRSSSRHRRIFVASWRTEFRCSSTFSWSGKDFWSEWIDHQVNEFSFFCTTNLRRTNLEFFFHFLLFPEMWAADAEVGPEGGQLTYDDLHEHMRTFQVPRFLTGEEPARLENIYHGFLNWLRLLPNVDIHLRNIVDFMEENLILSQMRTLRFAVMSQFYMRHPRYEIKHRRKLFIHF